MLPVNVYYDDLLQLLIATGTWTPTLAVVFGLIPEAGPLRRAMLAEVKRAYQAGVSSATGANSLNPRDNYGQGLNAELQHFVRAGTPPIEVLLAWRSSARTAGLSQTLR